MPVFQHDGVEFYYEQSGSGPAVVFCHGLSGDSTNIRDLLGELPGYSLLIWDARGHGRTQPVGPAGAFGFRQFAADLRALLNHLGIQQCVLGGVSMGAGVSVRLALDFPKLVSRLILVRPAWLDQASPEPLRALIEVGTLLERHVPDEGCQQFEQSPSGRMLRAQEPLVAEAFAEQFRKPFAADRAVRLQRIPRDCPISGWSELRDLTLPLLVVGCRDDYVHPWSFAVEWSHRVDGAGLVQVASRDLDELEYRRGTRAAIDRFLAASEPDHFNRIQTTWRRIVTPIPAPQSKTLLDRLRVVEPRSMSGMPPIAWDQAEGFLVRDPDGNQWIDLTSGIVAANAGHAHPRIAAAIQRTVDQKLLFTYAFAQEPRLALLEKLVELSPIPDSKAILFSSGTEATECAMLLMRRHGRSQHPEKVGIVSFSDSYHGRTLAAALASGKPRSSDWISRSQVHHYQIPFPFGPRWPWGNSAEDPGGRLAFRSCLDQLAEQNVGPQQIAGFLLETVPGWATWPMPGDFARALAEWARAHDILLCFDEVQSGCGRTGRFFGFEHCGITPDLITLGKGLSSSLPVSAVLGRRDLLDEPAAGEMSSTHGGNPVCAAAALANLQVLEDEQLIAAADTTGRLVSARLRTLLQPFADHVLSVHGPGLFISIHFRNPVTGEPDDVLGDAVVDEALRRGLLMFYTHRGFIKFTPPLSMDLAAAMEAADVLSHCVAVAISTVYGDRRPGPAKPHGM